MAAPRPSPEQASVLNTLADPASFDAVLISGLAGTGKSAVVTEWKRSLADRESFCELARTGGDHMRSYWSFSGLLDLRDDSEISSLENSAQCAEKISVADFLVVDNANFLSGLFLDAVDKVFRSVRRSDRPFGGARLIMAGDFFGLQPRGSPCFRSAVWRKLTLKAFWLSSDFRFGKNSDLLRLVSRCAFGTLQPEDSALLNSRKVASAVTKLWKPAERVVVTGCAQKAEVLNTFVASGKFNHQTVQVGGEAVDEFSVSARTGAEKAVVRSLARFPASVFLKKFRVQFLAPFQGVKVYNVQTKQTRVIDIVPGSLGQIVDFARQEYVISRADQMGMVGSFGHLDRLVQVEVAPDFRCFVGVFSEEVQLRGLTLMTRKQFPLRLAYAIPVHDVCGLQCPGLHLALSHSEATTIPGAFYTAVSRASNFTSLTIEDSLDCRRLALPGPSKELQDFLSGLFPREKFPWAAERVAQSVLGSKRPLPVDVDVIELSDN